MPQRHDIGWQKRQPGPKPEPIENTHILALDLVLRGLASKQILDVRTYHKDD